MTRRNQKIIIKSILVTILITVVLFSTAVIVTFDKEMHYYDGIYDGCVVTAGALIEETEFIDLIILCGEQTQKLKDMSFFRNGKKFLNNSIPGLPIRENFIFG